MELIAFEVASVNRSLTFCSPVSPHCLPNAEQMFRTVLSMRLQIPHELFV
jgi:hypothetical protein